MVTLHHFTSPAWFRHGGGKEIFDEFYEGAKNFLETKPGSFGGTSDEEVLRYLRGLLV